MKYEFKTLYDPGTAKVREDKFVAAPPFFAVFDGASGLYHPDTGPQKFDGVAGGQKAVELAVEAVKNAPSSDSIEDVALRINEALRKFIKANALDPAHPENLPGMEFAAAKVSDAGIDIIQGGDTFAVWVKKDGRSGATPNQNYSYEKALIELLQPLIEKHKGDGKAYWQEYLPLIAKARRERANKGGAKDYVVLNGDPAVEKVWNKIAFAPGDLQKLFLFTDGFVDFPETRDEKTMAALIAETYAQGGFSKLLSRIREIETHELKKRHIDHAEATAIAIEFAV